MNKKRILIGGGVVLILIAVAVVLALKYTASQNEMKTAQLAQQTAKKNSTTHTSPLSSDNSKFLETALNNPDKTERAKAVVPELRDSSWLTNADLPPGTAVTINRDSFHIEENGHGSMDGAIDGLTYIEFTLHLRQVDRQWLIESAEQKE